MAGESPHQLRADCHSGLADDENSKGRVHNMDTHPTSPYYCVPASPSCEGSLSKNAFPTSVCHWPVIAL